MPSFSFFRDLQKGGGEYCPNPTEHSQPHRASDDVEGEVDQGGALRVFIRPHGGEHGGGAGSDVLPHNDGDGRAVGDLPGYGQRLQNTHGGGAGLDERRERRPRRDGDRRGGFNRDNRGGFNRSNDTRGPRRDGQGGGFNRGPRPEKKEGGAQ